MKISTYLLLFAATLTTSAASGVQPEERFLPINRAEATIYRDRGFQGSAVFVNGERSDLGLRWSVGSIRIQSGTWELCARTRFREPCATVSSSEYDLRRYAPQLYMVQSMRPISYAPPVIAPPAGQSLRGMSAEFFPAPGDRSGRRILACSRGPSTANCASVTADDFCRSIGWNGSASETMETVMGRIYLADVLCTRSGY